MTENNEAEKRYQSSIFSKKWASTLVEAITKTEKEIKELKLKLETEKRKVYKANSMQIYDSRGNLTTLSELNERRRKGRISAYQMTLNDLRMNMEVLHKIQGNW